MREIKFRIWNKNENKMFEDVSLFNDDFTDMLNEHMRYLQTNKCIFMQYTGEKDKNGKEIYEGDILRQFREDNCFGEYESEEFIEIVKIPVYTEFSNWGSGGPDGDYPILEMEVIGNIYENEELLKSL